jgi:hypothetical protein
VIVPETMKACMAAAYMFAFFLMLAKAAGSGMAGAIDARSAASIAVAKTDDTSGMFYVSYCFERYTRSDRIMGFNCAPEGTRYVPWSVPNAVVAVTAPAARMGFGPPNPGVAPPLLTSEKNVSNVVWSVCRYNHRDIPMTIGS